MTVSLPEIGLGAAPLGNLYVPVADEEARSALEAARAPSGRLKLFSKPTRAWPPSSAAAVTQAVSRRPYAHTLHDWNRGMSGARNGRRSRGRAVRVSEYRPST